MLINGFNTIFIKDKNFKNIYFSFEVINVENKIIGNEIVTFTSSNKKTF